MLPTRRAYGPRLAAAVLALLTVVGCSTARPTARAPVRPASASVSPTGLAGGLPPQYFAPSAASFLTGQLGFVLGLAPCLPGGTTLCPALLRTNDGGQHWATLTPPPLLVLTDPARHPLLRFADAYDGVASDAGPGSPLAVTHDGGRSWALVPLRAAADAAVTAVTSDHGRVALVAGDAAGQRLWTATAGSDAFTVTGPPLPGTASTVSLTLAGTGGWLAAGGTYVVSTDGGATWRTARMPCAAGQRSALTATAGTGGPPTVVLVCQQQGDGLTESRQVEVSTDGGRAFAVHGRSDDEGYLVGVAAATATTLTVATSAASDNLRSSQDGGRSFALAYSSQAAGTGQGLFDLAFADATHGSVILGDTGSYALQLALGHSDVPTTRLLLTDDAGGHWTQAVFGP